MANLSLYIVENLLIIKKVYGIRKGTVKMVEELEEFRTILIGQILKTYTVH